MLTSKVDEPWLVPLHSSDSAAARLLCFPYAGGSPSVFAGWRQQMPDHIELWAVHYPGRGSRFNERPFSRLAPLVEELSPRLKSINDIPLIFFGHSLGALVAFETGRMMELLKLRGPARLFVSSCPAPHLLPTGPAVHDLPVDKLLGALGNLGGLPEEILDDDEILRLMLPVIRADLALLETYRYSVKSVLSLPITVFGGDQDPLTNVNELAAWKAHTSGSFRLKLYPGNHFYLHDNISDLIFEIGRVNMPDMPAEENGSGPSS